MWETCVGAVETVFQNDRTWQPFVMADHDAPPRAQARAPLYDDMKKRQKKRIFTNPSLGDEEIQIYVE